jgi:pimeloyl-ACP methyl ester carboxylesterase
MHHSENSDRADRLQPQSGSVRYLLSGAFYRLALTEWGAADAPVVICVHGLTRNGRDFDCLALALSDRYRVICPDLPGRGQSDWLPDPSLYHLPTYLLALSHLLTWIGKPVMWLGTSLGGICGMLIGAASGQPITRLILNDIGAFIPVAGLERIRDYIGLQHEFADMDALEAYLRRVHAPFGALTDRQWHHLALHSARSLPDGRVALHYDPAIAALIKSTPLADVDMAASWDRLSMPILAIRGESSDILLPDTLHRMQDAGASTHVVANAGHAPALMDSHTIEIVQAFLDAT